jgi:hypothetical protein
MVLPITLINVTKPVTYSIAAMCDPTFRLHREYNQYIEVTYYACPKFLLLPVFYYPNFIKVR